MKISEPISILGIYNKFDLNYSVENFQQFKQWMRYVDMHYDIQFWIDILIKLDVAADGYWRKLVKGLNACVNGIILKVLIKFIVFHVFFCKKKEIEIF